MKRFSMGLAGLALFCALLGSGCTTVKEKDGVEIKKTRSWNPFSAVETPPVSDFAG